MTMKYIVVDTVNLQKTRAMVHDKFVKQYVNSEKVWT